MRPVRNLLVAACVLAVVSGAAAQGPALPGAEPVLSHIPAGSVGFVVINNLKATAGKVDKFLAQIGVAQMLPSPDPDKPDVKMPVLSLLKAAAQVGEGFNDGGDLAAVMLDPEAFGVNLPALMGIEPPAEAAENQGPPKVPFVIFVPGKGIKEVFGVYEMNPAGKYTLINLRMGPTYAVQKGGYILLSPNEKALDAVLAAKKKAVSELPDEQIKALAKADLGYHVNMRVTGPILLKVFDKLKGQMAMEAGPMAPLLDMYFGFYGDLIKQLETATVTARLSGDGLVIEELASFAPDSLYGKAMLASKDAAEADLKSLPDLKHVLAIASVGESNEQAVKLANDFIQPLLATDFLKDLPAEQKARLSGLVKTASEQITGVQMVLGGAPAGKGLFGAAFVIQCKDSAKVKALLAEKAKFVEGLIHHFAKDEPDALKLKIRYVKGIETIGPVSADAITVEHPDLDTMEEQERSEMKKVLGEDKIRFLIAAADEKTVVVTFGGTKSMMLEALKVAGGKGTIGTAPTDLQAIKHLQKKRQSVMLFNAANLYDLIVAGMKAMAPEEDPPPFKISCKVPIAAGVGVTGKSAHVVIYVPTELIKEVTGILMMFVGGPGDAAPPVGGGDF